MADFTHFGKQEYWEDYYSANPKKTFDWFQNYSGIWDVFSLTFDPKIPRSEYVILDSGCGSSEVLKNLYLAGCSHLTGIDINPIVINFVKLRDERISNWINCKFKRSGLRCSSN